MSSWLRYLYPVLTTLEVGDGSASHNINGKLLAPSGTSLKPSMVSFFTNGVHHILYIGQQASQDLVKKLKYDREKNAILPVETLRSTTLAPESLPKDSISQISQLFEEYSGFKHCTAPLENVRVIFQGDACDKIFTRLLVEDQQGDLNNMIAYDDYLCRIHSLIKEEMSK